MDYSFEIERDKVRINLEGSFTFKDSRSFNFMLNSLKEMLDTAEVRLNMKRLEAIDAMAMCMLLLAFDMFKKMKMQLVFEQPKGQVQEALSKAAKYNALNIANDFAA